ncbi:hypothetical protein J4411_01060 [Candidatus Pacearchaeota archaeon]|nr:hypothetical protein [uncultured archaeon]MBS3084483.1 hypothetical protein [Candidatus Pacearchaeota archaeon]
MENLNLRKKDKMGLTTKLFGQRIDGDKLINLASALGINLDKDRLLLGEKWTSLELKGRVKLSPGEDGINIELYLLNEYYHLIDGTTNEDYVTDGRGEKVLIPRKKLFSKRKFHVKGKIKYPNSGGQN